MPLPKPRKGEKEKDFISRCMSDPVMKKEYPKRAGQKKAEQRLAVCYRQWRGKDKKKAMGEGLMAESKKYKCECLKCGHKLESAEHCRDIKCPKCGGTMRREERPGPGQLAFGDAEAKCAAQHFGPWMVEPYWFTQAVAALKAGALTPLTATELAGAEVASYETDGDGIAQISIHGQMVKGASTFGGNSTVRTRQIIREATHDDSVKGILLHIDSPGGTVAGSADLAAEVARTNQQKPVHAYIEDLGASAAYWVASQAARITANQTAQVGSIGTLAILEDTSGVAEKAGLKVHVVSSGAFKGAFVPGTEISDEHLDYARGMVEELNEHFLQGIKQGRHMRIDQVRKLADGRLYIAARAAELGLIDAVEPLDETVAELRKAARQAGKARAERAKRRQRIAEGRI